MSNHVKWRSYSDDDVDRKPKLSNKRQIWPLISRKKWSFFGGSTRHTRTEWVQRRFEANWKLPSTWKKNSSLLLETARALTAAPLIHPRPRVSYMWVCMCLELLMWELWCQSSFLYKVTAIPEKISEHWMLEGKTRVFSSNYFDFTHQL